MKTISRIVTFLSESTLGIIITVIIPTSVFYFGGFKNFNFIKLEIQKMEIAATIIFGLIIWSILFFNTQLKRLRIRQKYYDIMLTKFHDRYVGHPCTVFDKDLDLFSQDEQKYLQEYFDYQKRLHIEMKGRNTAMNAFRP